MIERCGVVLAATLASGCCFSGGPPPGVPEPTSPTAPRSPHATPGSCPAIEDAILGTWTRDGFVEEYRAGGVYVINGNVGTIRWLANGHAMLEVPPNLHEEYTLALADEDVLVAGDPNRIGTIYRRTSPSPGHDRECWNVEDEIVGTWAGGTFVESYAGDGSYRVNELTGSYHFLRNGLVHIETQAGTGDYRFALTSPTTAVAMLDQDGATMVEYTRTP